MEKILNTIYVVGPGVYLERANGAIIVKSEGSKVGEIPSIHVKTIVLFGSARLSSGLREWCLKKNVTITYLGAYGRYLGRLTGACDRGVLLRSDQHRFSSDKGFSLKLARSFVNGKLLNMRNNLMRNKWNDDKAINKNKLQKKVEKIDVIIQRIPETRTLEALRGNEGEAARAYFSSFNTMLRRQKADFAINSRTRRPPTDPLNSMLSFLYTLLAHDCTDAVLAAGFDRQVGFLHGVRPGRDSLALDLMEEFRPVLCDRTVLAMVNRCEVQADGFQRLNNGGIVMDDATRKKVISAYHQRKQEVVKHKVRKEPVSLGLIPYVQADILAQTVRGGEKIYLPYIHH